MKKINLILFFVFLLVLSSSVFAEYYELFEPPIIDYTYTHSYGIFKQNDPVNLIQNCMGSSYANITRVVYPNSSIVLDGQYSMTKVGDNYNFTFSNTSLLGRYLVYGECDYNWDGGILNSTWAYYFEITETGEIDKENTGTADISILIFIMVIAIGVFLLPFMVEEFSEKPYINFIIKRCCYVIAIYLMTYNAAIVSSIAKNSGIALTSELYSYMIMLGWAGYIAIIYLLVKTMFDVLKQWSIDKDEERTG